MKYAFAVTVYFCAQAFCLPSGAQLPDRTAETRCVDQVASYYASQGSFMGTVQVAEGNKLLLNKGYGLANLEWNIPRQPDAEFHLASVSEQFTAAAILLLQEDGKLRVTDPISRYLPITPKAWQCLTVDNLLSQTSGLRTLQKIRIPPRTFIRPWSCATTARRKNSSPQPPLSISTCLI